MRSFDARTLGQSEPQIMADVTALARRWRAGEIAEADLSDAVRALVPDGPLKVQIQTSTRCNAACAMCPYPEITSEPGFVQQRMSQARFEAMITGLQGSPVERISLFLMNEPLLDKRLPAWIALAKRRLPGVTFGLFTNGSAMNEANLRALAAGGLDELCVSVHGLDEATYRRVMGPLSFERAMTNAHRLLDLRDAGELGGMHVQLVAGDLPEIQRSIAAGDARLREAVVNKAFSNERAAAGVVADLASSGAGRGGAAAEAAVAVCQRPFVKLYLMWDGEAVICNVDWRRSVSLGRVNAERSVADVWHSDAYHAVRMAHVRGELGAYGLCERCDYPEVIDG